MSIGTGITLARGKFRARFPEALKGNQAILYATKDELEGLSNLYDQDKDAASEKLTQLALDISQRIAVKRKRKKITKIKPSTVRAVKGMTERHPRLLLGMLGAARRRLDAGARAVEQQDTKQAHEAFLDVAEFTALLADLLKPE